MIDYTRIVEKFKNHIGFRQWANPQREPLRSLTLSNSGIYYQDAHPLVTLENLYHVAPEFTRFEYDVYTQVFPRYYGEVVKDGSGNYYESLKNNNTEPLNDTDSWKAIDTLFEYWLEGIIESAICEAIRDYITKKSMFRGTKSLLAREQLYTINNEEDIEIADIAKHYSGFIIKTEKSQGAYVKVNKLGLSFLNPLDLTLFVKKVGGGTTSQVFSYTGGAGVIEEWFDVDYVFEPYSVYIIYYIKNSLEAKPVNTIRWQTNATCPFRAFQSDSLDEETFQYPVNNSFGLNFRYSVECDLTDFIIEQSDFFTNLIQYKAAIKFLQEIMFNPEALVNRNVNNVNRIEVNYEINGDTQGRKTGLGKQYEDALEAINLDTSGISKICLKCGNSNKVQIGSVFSGFE